jgi:phosphoribosylaminoimidazole-succinocarboxamide synthase
MSAVVWQTNLEGFGEPRRGKVRDIYDLGDSLLIVACDRISAYDHVLEPGIPGKGRILNQMSNFWFDRLSGVVENHLIATEVEDFPRELQAWREQLEGRSVLVRKAEVIPFECVARGFLAGSGYKEYLRDGTVCGIPLEAGLVRASRLAEAIYTPATKVETGHDENISFETLVEGAGDEMARRLRGLTLELYRQGAGHAEAQGLILADTKFEFGMVDDRLVLIDEVLTPDSSRYWEASQWQPGTEPVSVDKQYVRNWLDASGWDHDAPAPELPGEVVEGTLQRYREAFVRVTGSEPRL